MPKKGRIRIESQSNWWDCEDCGAITDDYLRIYHNGQKIVEMFSDGHFGAGDDLADVEGVLAKVLGTLNYEVTLERASNDNDY